MKDDVARRLARDLLAAACADDRPGVPLAQRLEDAAPAVLGPSLRDGDDETPPECNCRPPHTEAQAEGGECPNPGDWPTGAGDLVKSCACPVIECAECRDERAEGTP